MKASAPGRRAIYGKEAMEHFKEIGIIVYLKLSYEDLAKRLGNLKGRGVVLKEGQTLKDLYDERSKLYEQYAEITVDESGKDIRARFWHFASRLACKKERVEYSENFQKHNIT